MGRWLPSKCPKMTEGSHLERVCVCGAWCGGSRLTNDQPGCCVLPRAPFSTVAVNAATNLFGLIGEMITLGPKGRRNKSTSQCW